MNILFPQGKKKALTFSYDDGVLQDIRLAEMFRKYGMKATFNLNSGFLGIQQSLDWYGENLPFTKVSADKVKEVYEGFEVATHSLSHVNLTQVDEDMLKVQICDDIKNLEILTGGKIIGHAYAGGWFDDSVAKKIGELGIKYARTTQNTENFDLPENFLMWHPSFHDNSPGIEKAAERFVKEEAEQLRLLYIWGHSFELDCGNGERWGKMENLLKTLSYKEDIWYAENGEICEYLTKAKQVSEYRGYIINRSDITVFIELENEIRELKPGEIITK